MTAATQETRYIVTIDGSDSFIAESKCAIVRGLDDLHDGTIDTETCSNGSIYIIYITNTGQFFSEHDDH